MSLRLIAIIGLLLGGLILPAACRTPANQVQSPEPHSENGSTTEIVFYSWVEEGEAWFPTFDAFTAETGIKVRYEGYESLEEAVENMQLGKVYDVAVLENIYLSDSIAQGLLAPINRQNIPNFKNIMPSFRDLVYDPNNVYSIPSSWYITGLVVRSDLVDRPISHWADMWDPAYAGRVVNWLSTPRYTLSATLLMLGYSVNSEDALELEEAAQKLIELKQHGIWLDTEYSSAPLLVNGDAVMALGWVYDLETAREANVAVDFVFPEEGALLAGDSFVIGANSSNKAAAEALLNFILDAQTAADLISRSYYPLANAAALPYVDESILSNPIIFPPEQKLRQSKLMLPLSAEGARLHNDAWQKFLDAEN